MKTKYFLLTLIIGLIYTNAVVAYTLDEIKNTTDGKGVFSVTINNHGDDGVRTCVGVNLLPSPDGYEAMGIGCYRTVSVGAHSSVTIALIKPLVSEWPDYEGIGPVLSDNSYVRVYLGLSMIGQSIVHYEAKYIFGTKFLEVPDTIFNIGSRRREVQPVFAPITPVVISSPQCFVMPVCVDKYSFSSI